MFAGDPLKRNFTGDNEAKGMTWRCLPDQRDYHAIPNKPCPNGLRAQIFFPACWNGKDVRPPDGKSHMAYPTTEYNNGPCPKDFPIHLPSLFYEVYFNTTGFDSDWIGGKHPFVLASGDATGYGLQ